MSNFDKASNLVRAWVDSMGGLEAVRHDYGSDLSGLIQALDDAGLLAPDVQVIRTLKELEKLDPDTVLIESDGEEVLAYRMQKSIRSLGNESMYYDSLPATVIATGAQVRAAREAIKELSEENWEYAVQVKRGESWKYTYESWSTRWQGSYSVQEARAKRDHPGEETRIVRRRVSEPEVVNE